MITFAKTEMIPDLMTLWYDCFGDSENYIKLYFESRFKPQNTIVCIEDDKPVGMVTMLPITIRTPLGPMDGRYIYAVATHPNYRGRQISTNLMTFAHHYCRYHNVDLSILVPAEKSLFEFYNERGYTINFNVKNLLINADDIKKGNREITLNSTTLIEQENLRNKYFSRSHMFVKWDTRAIAYQDIEFDLTGIDVISLDNTHGYAVCMKFDEKVIIKEIVMDDISFDDVIYAIHKRYDAKSYFIRAWEDEKIQGDIAPFAMMKWYNDKKQDKLSDVAGKAPYIALVLD